MKKMLVFVNFREASMKALKQAAALVKLNGGQLHICHVSKNDDDEAQQNLSEYARIAEELGARVSMLAGKGEFFAEAPVLTQRVAPDLVVVGTVGIEGFSISHLGSAIYKLVRSLPVPSLVLQRNADIAASGYRHVMLPLSAHSNFIRVIKSLVEVMDSNGLVTVLGVTVNGAELHEALLSNAASAQNEMDRLGIKWTFKEVDVPKIASGYADIILDEMSKGKMDLIAMPADIAKRSQHFGKMDKEALLSNTHGIPVLCVNTDMA